MAALLDYDSDGHSEREDTIPESPDNASEQQQMLPDADAIIRETRDEMEQARLKADQLICQFAEAYVTTAGQLREVAIHRYRERLDGLPAEVCAKVCETLAKDDIFCCNMEFGNGHLSYGGMSFTYKVESDAAFNALSHHVWKDLNQFFTKDESSSSLSSAPEQGRPSAVHLMLSEDEEDELETQDRSDSSFEQSDSSSDEEDSLSYNDSIGTFHTENRVSDWFANDQTESSGAPKSGGSSRPSKHRGEPDIPEKRGPGRPPNEPWSAEEEAVVRETMATQLHVQGHLRCSRETTRKLMEAFPHRTASAISNKWLSFRAKGSWDEWGGMAGKLRVNDAKGKVRVEVPDLNKDHKEDSGPFVEYEEDNDEDLNDSVAKRGSHRNLSRIQSKCTPEKAPVSSSRLPQLDTPAQSEAADAAEPSGSRRKRQFSKEHQPAPWSSQEVKALIRLTEGSKKTADIDFKKVAALLPDPSTRTERACKDYWVKHIRRAPGLSKDQQRVHGGVAAGKGTNSGSNYGLRKTSKKTRKRGPDPNSDLGTAKLSKKVKSASNSRSVQTGTVENTSQGPQVHRAWTSEEDDVLWRLAMSGTPWRAVAAQIPQRTESECVTHFNCFLAKLPQYQKEPKGQSGRPDRRRADYRQALKADQCSLKGAKGGDTVSSMGRRSRGAQEPGEEDKKRIAAMTEVV